MALINELTLEFLNKTIDIIHYWKNNSFPKDGLLYLYTDNKIYYPNHFVYNNSGILWICIRSTSSLDDWKTDFDMEEIDAKFGSRQMKVHRGFYWSAQHIYQNTKEYIMKHNGRIIFTGTSLGGTVCGVLAHMALTDPDLKGKDINSIGFAGAPCMEYVPVEYRKRIIQFVNQDDIITTVSIPNLYDTVRDAIEEGDVKQEIQSLVEKAKINASFYDNVAMMVNMSLDGIVERLNTYHKDKNSLKIRYIWGTVYHIKAANPYTPIKDLVVNATEINRVNIWGTAFQDHLLTNYKARLMMIDQKPDDKMKNATVSKKFFVIVTVVLGFIIVGLILALIIAVCTRKSNKNEFTTAESNLI